MVLVPAVAVAFKVMVPEVAPFSFKVPELKDLAPVMVSVVPRPIRVSVEFGKVMTAASPEEVKVMVFWTVRVLAAVIARVPSEKINFPLPFSSLMTPASSAEVVAAKTESLLAVRATVPEASGRVIVRRPEVEAPVILQIFVAGVPEEP